MKAKFCPNCRRQIVLPKWLIQGSKNGNFQGNVVLNCGNCSKGKVKIKPEKKEENANS